MTNPHAIRFLIVAVVATVGWIPSEAAAQTTTQVTVYGTDPWTDTGIDIATGDTIDITASGEIKNNAGNPDISPDGQYADGYGPIVPCPYVVSLPTVACWSLIGRIGEGVPFAVGYGISVLAEHSGRLYLGVNDEFFLDNSGAWSASVTVWPPVTDTTAPGGVWISPDHNFVTQDNQLDLKAQAYDNADGSGVEHVNFTAYYDGTWFPVCTINAPDPGTTDIYSCPWEVSELSPGPIEISFDVYDQAGNYSLAPHGTRQGTISRGQAGHSTGQPPNMRPPMRGSYEVIGDNTFHTDEDAWAVDFTSDDPTIYPTAPGTIVFAGENCDSSVSSCYGQTVVIDHGRGYYSIYAHLAPSGLPQPKTRVNTNTPIGTMSNTGCFPACEVHLHFVMRYGDEGLEEGAIWSASTPVRTPWR